MGPSVTVIIPAFNAELTIRESIASVLAQTYVPLEIIVVDDGSTDRTAYVVSDLANVYPSIALIRKPHAGVCEARNAALAASRGEFVAPLDADDLWHPEKLARQVDALCRAGTQTAVAYSPALRFEGSGRIVGAAPTYWNTGNVFSAQLRYNLVGNGSGMLVRRDALLEVGGYPPWLGGSEEYHLQLLIARRHYFVAVPWYLVAYRKSPGSLSSDEPRLCQSRVNVLRSLAPVEPQYRSAHTVAVLRAIGAMALVELRHSGPVAAWIKVGENTSTRGPAMAAIVFTVIEAACRAFRWAHRHLYRPRQLPVKTAADFLSSPPIAASSLSVPPGC